MAGALLPFIYIHVSLTVHGWSQDSTFLPTPRASSTAFMPGNSTIGCQHRGGPGCSYDCLGMLVTSQQFLTARAVSHGCTIVNWMPSFPATSLLLFKQPNPNAFPPSPAPLPAPIWALDPCGPAKHTMRCSASWCCVGCNRCCLHVTGPCTEEVVLQQNNVGMLVLPMLPKHQSTKSAAPSKTSTALAGPANRQIML